MEDCLYVVMPAYNEEENIKDVVTSWYAVLEGKSKASRIVVADSGSTDSTHEILMSLRSSLPQLEILENTGKQHGPKVIALYKYAIEAGADYVFQTDSDGQTNPEEFEKFWKLREEYDGIFGYRNKRGDGKARAFVENVVCFLLKVYFGVKVPDANAPFRLMNTTILKKYINRLPEDFNIPNIMFTTYFVKYNEKTHFEIISFENRKAGKNSINIRKIIKIGWKAMGDFKKLKEEM